MSGGSSARRLGRVLRRRFKQGSADAYACSCADRLLEETTPINMSLDVAHRCQSLSLLLTTSS